MDNKSKVITAAGLTTILAVVLAGISFQNTDGSFVLAYNITQMNITDYNMMDEHGHTLAYLHFNTLLSIHADGELYFDTCGVSECTINMTYNSDRVSTVNSTVFPKGLVTRNKLGTVKFINVRLYKGNELIQLNSSIMLEKDVNYTFLFDFTKGIPSDWADLKFEIGGQTVNELAWWEGSSAPVTNNTAITPTTAYAQTQLNASVNCTDTDQAAKSTTLYGSTFGYLTWADCDAMTQVEMETPNSETGIMFVWNLDAIDASYTEENSDPGASDEMAIKINLSIGDIAPSSVTSITLDAVSQFNRSTSVTMYARNINSTWETMNNGTGCPATAYSATTDTRQTCLTHQDMSATDYVDENGYVLFILYPNDRAKNKVDYLAVIVNYTGGDNLSANFTWQNNGAAVTTYNTNVACTNNTICYTDKNVTQLKTKNDNWTALARCYDGVDHTNESDFLASDNVTIANTAPITYETTMSAVYDTNTNLIAYTRCSDVDADALKANFTWFLNDVANDTYDTQVNCVNSSVCFSTKTLGGTLLVLGDNWTASAKCYDGSEYSADWVNSTTKEVTDDWKSYAYYGKLLNTSFERSQTVSSTLQNYIATIHLDTSNASMYDTTTCKNILFYFNGNLTTPDLLYEVVSGCGTNDTILEVQSYKQKNNSQIGIYTINVTNQSNYNVSAMWNLANAKAVYHFEQDVSDNVTKYLDSANGQDLTVTSCETGAVSYPTQIDTPMGHGFQTVAGCKAIASNADPTFIPRGDTSYYWYAVMEVDNSTGNYGFGAFCGIAFTGTGASLKCDPDGMAYNSNLASAGAAAANFTASVWNHLQTYRSTGDAPYIRVNNSLGDVGTDAATAFPNAASTLDVPVWYYGPAEAAAGNMTELRIYSVIPSTDWMNAETSLYYDEVGTVWAENFTGIGNDTEVNPPITTAGSITPNPAYSDSTLNASVTCSDIDVGDALKANFTWYKNGANEVAYDTQVSCTNNVACWTDVLVDELLVVDDNWTASVICYDGTAYSAAWENTTNVTITSSATPECVVSPANSSDFYDTTIINVTITNPGALTLTNYNATLVNGTDGSEISTLATEATSDYSWNTYGLEDYANYGLNVSVLMSDASILTCNVTDLVLVNNEVYNISVAFGTGITSFNFTPTGLVSVVNVTGQNVTNPVYNITNNGNETTCISIKQNSTWTNLTLECASSSDYVGAMNITTAYQNIVNVTASDNEGMWCRLYYNNELDWNVSKSRKLLMNATGVEACP